MAATSRNSDPNEAPHQDPAQANNQSSNNQPPGQTNNQRSTQVMTEGPPDANQHPNTQNGTAIDEASSSIRWGKMIWNMLFRGITKLTIVFALLRIVFTIPMIVCVTLRRFHYPISEELLEKANELAVYFTPLSDFTTITSQVASAVQRAATYSNKERVECLLELRAACTGFLCLSSEKIKCEIYETQECYDYKLGGCLTDWQAEYLKKFAKRYSTHGLILAVHFCALSYLITFLFSDLWIFLYRWDPSRRDDVRKDEQWALAMHFISFGLTLSASLAGYIKLNDDPRRICFISVAILAGYSALMLILQFLHHYGFRIWRGLMACVMGVPNYVQHNIQGYVQNYVQNYVDAQGNAQGNVQGIALEDLRCNTQDNVQDNVQGNTQDNARGIVQGNAQDNVQDNVQGDAQGNVQGNEDERRTASADSAESSVSTGREHKGHGRRRRPRKDSGNPQSQQAAASVMNSSLYEPRDADESNSENSKHEDHEDGGKLQLSKTDSNLSRKKDGQSATNNESVEMCTSEVRNVASKEQGENSSVMMRKG
ncbi:hypothetical protein CJI97_002129 [Candidozyma auris]|nr:hypothetical protein CJI97_002129 [[Candida] auris]